jgi:hypothetical protein
MEVVPILVVIDVDPGDVVANAFLRLAQGPHVGFHPLHVPLGVGLAVDLLREAGERNAKVVGSGAKDGVRVSQEVEVAADAAEESPVLDDADQLRQSGVKKRFGPIVQEDGVNAEVAIRLFHDPGEKSHVHQARGIELRHVADRTRRAPKVARADDVHAHNERLPRPAVEQVMVDVAPHGVGDDAAEAPVRRPGGLLDPSSDFHGAFRSRKPHHIAVWRRDQIGGRGRRTESFRCVSSRAPFTGLCRVSGLRPGVYAGSRERSSYAQPRSRGFSLYGLSHQHG